MCFAIVRSTFKFRIKNIRTKTYLIGSTSPKLGVIVFLLLFSLSIVFLPLKFKLYDFTPTFWKQRRLNRRVYQKGHHQGGQ
jgi:hypothetical protein